MTAGRTAAARVMKEIADVTMVTAGSVAKVKQEYREASTRIDQALNTLKGELVRICLFSHTVFFLSLVLDYLNCVCVRQREKTVLKI